MSRDPTSNSVLRFKKKDRPKTLAEALLQPTPLEPDAGEPLPRGKKLYGQTPIRWLQHPPMPLPPVWRLYFYLQIKSRRGARTVRLTNEMAAEVGLDRFRKAKALRVLERAALVTAERKGKRLPVVTVRRFASTDYD